MKRIGMVMLVLLLAGNCFAATGLANGPKTLDGQTFRWADDEDYRPFIYRDDDGEIRGIFKELMVEIFARIKVPLTCNVYAWQRTQKYVENGLADGMVTVLTKERARIFTATDPLLTAREVIFTSRDNPRFAEIQAITSLQQFKGFKVIDYVGAGWAREHFKGLDVIWAPKYKNVLLMLAANRADIFLADKLPGYQSIQSLIRQEPVFADRLKKLVACSHPISTISFSLLVRKDSKWVNIIGRVNRTLTEMKADGTYDRIVKKYQSPTPEENQERAAHP